MVKRNLMVFMGILVLVVGFYGMWDTYHVEASPLDIVDVPNTSLDEDKNFIPLLQPQELPSGQMAPEVAITDDTINRSAELNPERTSETASDGPGFQPDRLVIQKLHVDAPVVPMHFKEVDYKNQVYDQWLVPTGGMVGWHDTSAWLGKNGNTVFNGHHNAYGKVFKDLIKLEPGDVIQVYSGEQVFSYEVGTKMLLPERNQPVETRLENARWVLPSSDERLTLITCWPANSNTHRVVVVAFPLEQNSIQPLITDVPIIAPTSTPFAGLSLVSLCSPDKEYYLWQVDNKNRHAVNFEYVIDSGYSGVGVVPAGATADIQTPVAEGKILLLYSSGILQASRSVRVDCK